MSGAQARMVTGLPTPRRSASWSMTSFDKRMHPSDWASPIELGRLVPWIPMIPSPPLKLVTVSERAERPKA